MPHFPAEPGRPRELTRAEWAALQVIWRHQRLPLAPIGAGLVAFTAYMIYRSVQDLGSDPAKWFAIAMVSIFGLLGLLLLTAAFYKEPERPKGRPRRVGRLVGRVVVGGKPTRVFVGPVPVVIPAAMGGFFPLGQEVDIEILPPLEDEPRPRIARHIISVGAGRHWIGDPGMTKGWGKATGL